MDTQVKVDDVQVRLTLVLDEKVSLSTSWYGPKDKMRFAVVTHSDQELTQEERVKYESRAVSLFDEKIKALEKLLCGILSA